MSALKLTVGDPALPSFKYTCPRISSSAVGAVVPMPIRPLCLMTKRFNPDEEAVKMSPTPLLSTVREANEVAPEIEATGIVPLLLRISRVARGVAAPIPTLPEPAARRRFLSAAIVVSPFWTPAIPNRTFHCTSSLAPGDAVPIPTLVPLSKS